MSGTLEIIKSRITTQLNPASLQVIDESAQHIGHPGAAGGGGHFRVKISADAFKSASRVSQHREIYSLLQDLIDSKKIHALAIEII